MNNQLFRFPIYTTIIHEIRVNLEISCNDYCVADMIYHLSNNPSAKINGWCYASKDTLAGYLGLSTQSIHNIINSLIKNDLIEKDQETKYLRTTEKWYNDVILKKIHFDSKETLLTVKKVDSEGQETLHNNNKDNNIKENNKKEKETAKEYPEFFQKCLDKYNDSFGTKFKSYVGWNKNASFWLTVYSEDEILEAIGNIKSDQFWKDKMDLTTLFRRKNPRGEDVDYIAKMLNQPNNIKQHRNFMIGGRAEGIEWDI